MAFISVDVEASGPLPGFFDLLSIGAVAVEVADRAIRIAEGGFYVEIAPLHGRADPAAMRVNRLDLTRLAREGVPLPLAARRFADWTRSVSTDLPCWVTGSRRGFSV